MTVKRCSTSVIIRELQTKTTMKYHVTSYRVAILKKKKKDKSLRRCGKKGTLVHCWRGCKLVQLLGRQYRGPPDF